MVKIKMAELGLSLNVSSVLCDFELNILKSVDEIVDAEIFGCFFHHRDCFRKRVDNKGLRSRYNNDQKFHEFVSQASSLAHLPIADIEKGLNHVQHSFAFGDEQATTFKDYLIHFIIGFLQYLTKFFQFSFIDLWMKVCTS